MTDAVVRRRLVITGRVQNVSYRDWFVGQMRALGVRGWVRNRANGTVEAVLEAPGEVIDAAIVAAHRGSPASRVEQVAVDGDVPPGSLGTVDRRATL